MEELGYGFKVRLPRATIADVRQEVSDALAEEGFGVLSEIDVSAAFKKKLGIEYRPYLILGACNPQLAHQALQQDPHLGLLLPCNVVLQEGDGGVIVSIQDPKAIFAASRPELSIVADEARVRLRRVAERLNGDREDSTYFATPTVHDPQLGNTLADGRPGSSRPISESHFDSSHSGSVRNGNPHRDRKLSSNRSRRNPS